MNIHISLEVIIREGFQINLYDSKDGILTTYCVCHFHSKKKIWPWIYRRKKRSFCWIGKYLLY